MPRTGAMPMSPTRLLISWRPPMNSRSSSTEPSSRMTRRLFRSTTKAAVSAADWTRVMADAPRSTGCPLVEARDAAVLDMDDEAGNDGLALLVLAGRDVARQRLAVLLDAARVADLVDVDERDDGALEGLEELGRIGAGEGLRVLCRDRPGDGRRCGWFGRPAVDRRESVDRGRRRGGRDMNRDAQGERGREQDQRCDRPPGVSRRCGSGLGRWVDRERRHRYFIPAMLQSDTGS